MSEVLSAVQSVFNYRFILQYQEQFLLGIENTVIAAGLSLVLSLVFGFVIALMQMSGRWPLTFAAKTYVQVIRSTPLLLQIYVIYFGLPVLLPSIAKVPEIVLGTLALTIHTAAYMSEIIRSGLQAVPRGQNEGAIALGMTTLQRYRYVVVPQGIVNVIPALLGQTAILIKDSSLLSLITVFDIVSAGMLLNSDLVRPNEGFLSVAVIFFVFYLMMVFFSRYVERKLAGHGWRAAR
ncbi:amino acid ABC transporter permease [Pseudomonas kurunegalensis]|uniref:amino acid ABC transporter permease n=1 Tax=Pseudomonas kurunegalensis TaxID=485880 RepID=UPI002570DEE4|nr:amino acid ABC transporter permease [Pseudomonas kurunegalensis]WJD65097.1 amino acid ABC transporter permease [Pseudomonas kurunegalensis]